VTLLTTFSAMPADRLAAVSTASVSGNTADAPTVIRC
jgi:hypothetical protein